MKRLIPAAVFCLLLIACQNSKPGSPRARARVVPEHTIGWTIGDGVITVGTAKRAGRLGLRLDRLRGGVCGSADIELGPEHAVEDFYGRTEYAFVELPALSEDTPCSHASSQLTHLDPSLTDRIIRVDNPYWRKQDPYRAVLEPIPADAPAHHLLISLASTHVLIERSLDGAESLYLVFDVATKQPVGLAVPLALFSDDVPTRHLKAEGVSANSSVHPILVNGEDRAWRAKERVASCLKRAIDENLFFEATQLGRDPAYRERILDSVEHGDLSDYPNQQVQLCLASH